MGLRKQRAYPDRYQGVQYGFEYSTAEYREWYVSYGSETVIYYEFGTRADSGVIQVVPDGCVDFLFCCDSSDPHGMICGSVLSGQNITLRQETIYFGVRLTPALSMRLPMPPLRELVEVQAPLEEVMPEYRYVAALLGEQTSLEARILCFERHCQSLLQTPRSSSPSLVEYCLNEMHRNYGIISVHKLADQAGYSERYLRNQFENALGITPKMYNRIIRFQHTLFSIMSDPSSLMEIAVRTGYYDQAHFVKEFKAFSQFTPLQLKKEKDKRIPEASVTRTLPS